MNKLMQKSKKLIVIISVLIFMLIGCSESPKDEKEMSNTKQKDPIESGQSLGNESPVEVKLNSIEIISGEHSDQLEDGYDLLVLDLFVKNIGDRDYYFSATNVHLLINNEQMYLSTEISSKF